MQLPAIGLAIIGCAATSLSAAALAPALVPTITATLTFEGVKNPVPLSITSFRVTEGLPAAQPGSSPQGAVADALKPVRPGQPAAPALAGLPGTVRFQTGAIGLWGPFMDLALGTNAKKAVDLTITVQFAPADGKPGAGPKTTILCSGLSPAEGTASPFGDMGRTYAFTAEAVSVTGAARALNDVEARATTGVFDLTMDSANGGANDGYYTDLPLDDPSVNRFTYLAPAYFTNEGVENDGTFATKQPWSGDTGLTDLLDLEAGDTVTGTPFWPLTCAISPNDGGDPYTNGAIGYAWASFVQALETQVAISAEDQVEATETAMFTYAPQSNRQLQ